MRYTLTRALEHSYTGRCVILTWPNMLERQRKDEGLQEDRWRRAVVPLQASNGTNVNTAI